MLKEVQRSNGRAGTNMRRFNLLNSVTWVAAIASGATRSPVAQPHAGTPISHADLTAKLGVWVDRILPLVAAVLIAVWTISFVALGLDFVARFPG